MSRKTDAPIGFDETPPETPEVVTGAHAFPCYDHVPRTICPPLTIGGTIRSMDNHQLAKYLAAEAAANFEHVEGPWTEDEYFDWLNKPAREWRQHFTGGSHEDIP